MATPIKNDTVLLEVRRIFNKYLENHKLRKTPERITILEEIYSWKGHFDAEELYSKMKDNKYNVSRATVYNTLDLLVSSELVTKHQFGQNHAQYEKSFGSRQHDHIICLDCGTVKEFCDPRLGEIEETAGDIFDFEIKNHSLTLYAHCTKDGCEGKG